MRFGNAIHVRDGLATALVNRRTPKEARDALLAEQPPRSRREQDAERALRAPK